MVKAEDTLVDCPRNCGYKVKLKHRGEPHKIVDPLDSSNMIWCQ